MTLVTKKLLHENLCVSGSCNRRNNRRNTGKSRLATLILVAALSVLAVGAIIYFAWPKEQKLVQMAPIDGEVPKTPSEQALMKAQAFCQAGMMEKAIAALEKHKAEYPGEVIVLPTLARLYLETNQFDKANELVDEIIKLAPNNAKVWWLRGQLDMAASKDPMPSYAKAADMPDAPADIKGRYGVELFKRKKIDQARSYITQAVAGGVQDPYVFYAAGLHAKVDGDNQLALQMLTSSLKLEPKNGPGWVDLATVQKKLSMDSAAVESLQRSLNYLRGKKRQDVLLELGAMLAEQKKWNQAGECFATAAKGAGALRLLACTEAAKCYWRGGKYALAMQNIDYAYEIAPDNKEVLAWRVKIENSRFGQPKTKE